MDPLQSTKTSVLSICTPAQHDSQVFESELNVFSVVEAEAEEVSHD